jgi:DMSO reductase anchor subunit (DmsC).
MIEIISIVTLPVFLGILLFFVPEKFRTIKGIIALLVSIITGYLTIVIYSSGNQLHQLNELSNGSTLFVFGFDFLHDAGRYMAFNCDNLSKLIILFISLFTI